MAYVTVPKDLTKSKQGNVQPYETTANLFQRGGGNRTAAVLFGKRQRWNERSGIVHGACHAAYVLLAMYEKNGQPLEVIIRQFVEVKFLRPKERPYQTNNFYAALARQEQLDKEVRAIVKGKEKHPKRKA